MSRLSKEQWLDHGLHQLAQHGFTVLKADTLAKSLGVSRGSFYWHFKDLGAFHRAVLAHWYQVTVAAIIQDIETQEVSPHAKLERLIRIAVGSSRSLERAVRAWSFYEPAVQTTLADVDAKRLEYVTTLLSNMGLDDARAQAKARVIYCGYLGQVVLSDDLSQTQQSSIIDELMSIADTQC
ncbi:MAG: TetR/AcrR family transcriptional regulator [Deinococcota bacterium]